MLLELDIRNIALAEDVRIEFEKGFNVLTGETGAGKSIVVDSMELVLGGRADRDIIRTGAEKASVTAVFNVRNSPAVLDALSEEDIFSEDDELIITRELTRAGRSTARIAGIPVSLSQVRRITSLLMDIHGQHEHQQLLDHETHIGYLDAFGTDEELLTGVKAAYQARSEKAAKLKKLMRETEKLKQEREKAAEKTEDVRKLRLKKGEKEKLEKKLDFLSRADEIQRTLSGIYREMAQGSETQPGVQAILRDAVDRLKDISATLDAAGGHAERFMEAFYIVEDTARDVQSLAEKCDSDPEMLSKVEGRLQEIYRLEKRYGADSEELIAFAEEASRNWDRIDQMEDEIRTGKAEWRELDTRLREACDKLTEVRKSAAIVFTEKVTDVLKDLGMGKCVFQVDIRPLEKPTGNGMDEVEFMISANPGEPVKPLGSVASGGELSRVMLALKTVTGEKGVDAMVFDEIDTGISGLTAAAVGKKMKDISRTRQVICVTHHASIAAMGDTQFLVAKATDGERTRSSVERLDGEGREREIVRLIDGGTGGEASFELARSMLNGKRDQNDREKEWQ